MFAHYGILLVLSIEQLHTTTPVPVHLLIILLYLLVLVESILRWSSRGGEARFIIHDVTGIAACTG